ncbi:MAG: cytochrome C oxidase subunit IV family protein [Chitinophagales bacterium]|nr:cytochrome C oxidase subunit IV family protein [Chitinophagales bacterium]
MSNQNVTVEATLHHAPADNLVKRIWKTFWILLIITIVELALGLLLHKLDLPDNTKRMMIKGVIIILSLAKAYFIVAIFMHLGDEMSKMILSILIPLLLIIWVIVAFLIDGTAYKQMRNRYDKSFNTKTMNLPQKQAPKGKTVPLK